MFQEILIKPVLTEKMAIMQERENKYAFIVMKSANKIQIKQAIENKFDVKVLKISTMNFNGKIKQMTTKSNGRTIRTEGKKSSFIKTIVTLVEGESIDFINGDVSK